MIEEKRVSYKYRPKFGILFFFDDKFLEEKISKAKFQSNRFFKYLDIDSKFSTEKGLNDRDGCHGLLSPWS